MQFDVTQGLSAIAIWQAKIDQGQIKGLLCTGQRLLQSAGNGTAGVRKTCMTRCCSQRATSGMSSISRIVRTHNILIVWLSQKWNAWA